VQPTPPQADPRHDQELIAAINAGDATAFDVLYYRYRHWVAALAQRFTANHDDALDVMQDTFMYLLGKFPGFELSASLKTFLYPVVKHLAQQRRRKTARHTGADIDLEVIPARPTGSGPDELVQVLANLPAQLSEVLLLRFVDGLNLNEIAKAVSIPLGTVKSRLHRALASLRSDERTKKYFER
jgi:RNA polymerase sigma-70 factor (ECF subfamily)